MNTEHRSAQVNCLRHFKFWALAALVTVSASPSRAYGSDFGGLAIIGLMIMAVLLGIALALSAATAVVLNRKYKQSFNWWWFTPLFTVLWGYVLFQLSYLLR